jgi:hypothetical protein
MQGGHVRVLLFYLLKMDPPVQPSYHCQSVAPLAWECKWADRRGTNCGTSCGWQITVGIAPVDA